MKKRFTYICNMIGYFFMAVAVLLVLVPVLLLPFIPELDSVFFILVYGGIISGAVGAVLVCQ